MIRAGLLALVLSIAVWFWWHRNGDTAMDGEVGYEVEVPTKDLDEDGDGAMQADASDGDPEGGEDGQLSDDVAADFAREKIHLINAQQAPIVKVFKATTAMISNIDQRTIPFAHFWSEEVRAAAKSRPILAGIDELLDNMMQ